MENIRKKNVASLIFNISIIFFTIESFCYGFRSDVIHDPDWLGFEGIHSLRFFTVLSNLFVAVLAIIMVVYNIKNIVNDKYDYPNWLITIKHTATTAVAVTFTTVALLLAPSYAIVGKGYFTLFLGNHVYMHLLSPVLAIITLILFETSHKITFKESLLSLIPVVLYSILYITMVVFVGAWPDFYNFTFGGHYYLIPFSALGMLLMTFGLSLLIATLHNKQNIKQEQIKWVLKICLNKIY